MALISILSFRLGASDGVSIESAKWIAALRQLGHDVRTIAGDGVADVILDGLAIEATSPPSRDELRAAVDESDLIIVENLVSLPLNVRARDVVYQVLHERRAILHHHDLAWQRAHLAHLEGPRDEPLWRHVTINDLSRRELLDRGIEAVTIMNSFDCDPPHGDRSRARPPACSSDERLVLLPTRAIARKNIQGALDLCASLNATLWILGPAEDGYEPELDRVLSASKVTTVRGLAPEFSIHDAYAAADLVVMPSTWEGFGNPVLESVTHRRPLALNPYPVAREIAAFGFTFFDLSDVEALDSFLDHPDDAFFEGNLEIARKFFNVVDLPERLAALLKSVQIH
ncbi:MAG: glycosyltransferase [Acidimicrobiales bacterium]